MFTILEDSRSSNSEIGPFGISEIYQAQNSFDCERVGHLIKRFLRERLTQIVSKVSAIRRPGEKLFTQEMHEREASKRRETR